MCIKYLYTFGIEIKDHYKNTRITKNRINIILIKTILHINNIGHLASQ